MASVASSCLQVSSEETRPAAGPLPSKLGEIGYVEGAHEQEVVERRRSPETVLPARHPADRDTLPVVDSARPIPNSSNPFISPSSSTLDSVTESTAKRKHILGFLQPKKVPTFGGVYLTTLLAATSQILLGAATIAGWVLTVQNNARHNTAGPSGVVIHITFAVVVLGQIIFLERRLYRLRAERYTFLHPGEILPTSRNFQSSDPDIAFSPWNRPPLPTYAAALAQSGTGTGDVEDHLIAVPPPPAYGNTRGSTLILAGYMRDSLRAQRPVSEYSQRGMRPISYVSRDEEWEEIQDAERARRLEETLAQLERPAISRS